MTKQKLHSLVLSMRSGSKKITFKNISEIIEKLSGSKFDESTLANWAEYDTYAEYCSDMRRRNKESIKKKNPTKDTEPDVSDVNQLETLDLVKLMRELLGEFESRIEK